MVSMLSMLSMLSWSSRCCDVLLKNNRYRISRWSYTFECAYRRVTPCCI